MNKLVDEFMTLNKQDFDLIQYALEHYYWHLHEINNVDDACKIVKTEAKIYRIYAQYWRNNYAEV